MKPIFFRLIFLLLSLFFLGSDCANEELFLGGIKRVADSVFTPCDPYNQGKTHSCVVFARAFSGELFIYDASVREMVLSPIQYFPLRVKVGPGTENLSLVMGANTEYPFMFALDTTMPAIYAVRLFGSADKSIKSFGPSIKNSLPIAPAKMATFLADKDHVIAILSFPNEHRIELRAINAQSGLFDNAIAAKSINLGTKPSHISIDHEAKFALVSDEGANNIFRIDLSNVMNHMMAASNPTIDPIDVGFYTDRIYLANRNWLANKGLVAMVMDEKGQHLALVDVSNLAKKAVLKLRDFAVAGYFPEFANKKCCNGISDWFLLANIKGNLNYIAIVKKGSTFSLEPKDVIDLGSTKNLGLKNLHVSKLVGGQIIKDPSVKRKNNCDQKIFISTSYAEDPEKGVEVEGHSSLCEGEKEAMRLGLSGAEI